MARVSALRNRSGDAAAEEGDELLGLNREPPCVQIAERSAVREDKGNGAVLRRFNE